MKRHWVYVLPPLLFACSMVQVSTPRIGESPPAISTSFTMTPPPVTETATIVIDQPSHPTPTLRANVPLEARRAITITSIKMFDAQNGWGFDTNGHILRTRDGGSTWRDVIPPLGNFSFQGFFSLDAETAWATFFQGLYSGPTSAFVWRTTDGGENWQRSGTFPLTIDRTGNTNPSDYYLPTMLQFINLQRGWLLVDVYSGMHSTRPLLFQTSDSGGTWDLVNDHYHDLNAAVAVGFAFLDERNGWLGQNGIPVKFGMHNIDEIVADGGWHTSRTMDGGVSFPADTQLPLTDELKRPEYENQIADCGETKMMSLPPAVVGIEWSCLIHLDGRPKLIRTFSLTSSGGDSWVSFPASGNEFFLDGHHGWRLFSPGQLQATTDGGLTWKTIKTVIWENAEFDFVNERIGWGVVSNEEASAFVHTVDGGVTWTEIKPLIAP